MKVYKSARLSLKKKEKKKDSFTLRPRSSPPVEKQISAITATVDAALMGTADTPIHHVLIRLTSINFILITTKMNDSFS